MSDDAGSRVAGNTVRTVVVGLVILATAAGTAVAPPAAGGAQAAGQPAAPAADAQTADNRTSIVHAGDRLSLASGPGQVVHGRTDAPPGTELTVRVRSTDDDQPYLRSRTAVVTASGTFRAVFDLAEVAAGTDLRVTVFDGGTNLTSERAVVVACEAACEVPTPGEPSAVVEGGRRPTVQSRPGQVLAGQTNLPPGATVTVRVASSGADQPFLKSRRAVVDENGTFQAVFDFEDIEGGVSFEVTVIHDGTTLTETAGRVRCAGDCPTETTPTATPRRHAEFQGAAVGVVQVENGSVARIRIDLGDADAAKLTVGGPGTDYRLAVTVADGDDDGNVVLLFDTAAAASGGISVRTAGEDRLQVDDERGTFVAAEYRLSLHPPTNASATVATGLLVVTQDGSGGTPLVTGAQGGTGPPLVGVLALAAGSLLAVAGLGSLLGLLDLRRLLG